MAADAAGGVFIADTNNSRVRKVTPDGLINTFAGGGGQFSGDGGRATGAVMNFPYSLVRDTSGNLYVADAKNNRIRKVARDGTITTFAGNGSLGYAGDGGVATSAVLNEPRGVAVDANGNLYVTDTRNNRIRKVTADGAIRTLAGNGFQGFAGDGGPAVSAQLNNPNGIALDSAGNLYFADSYNHRIREVTAAGVIKTIAGNGTQSFSGDGGPATNAALNYPYGLALDAAGNLYVSDTLNNRVRRVTPDGNIGTIAGNGVLGFSGDGGPATSAALYYPTAATTDSAGNVYIADTFNSRVRKIAGDGMITTVAGNGNPGFSGDGGLAASAALDYPYGVTLDSMGNLYVADTGNNRIREVLAAPPSFTAAPVALSFTAASASATPPAQTVHVAGSIPGLAFSVQASDTWLAGVPQSGSLPADLQVTVDPSQLAAGSYAGTVTITVPGANPRVQTVTVNFTVTATTPGKLALGNQSLAFALTQGTSGSSLQLTVLNQGGGSIAFTAAASTTTGGDWLQVTPTGGSVTATAQASLTITATPATLSTGTYSGSITVTNTSGGPPLVVPVALAISPSQQKIVLSQIGLTLTAVAQGGTVLPQSVGILNVGSGSMNWTAQASTLSGSGWLRLSASSGTVNQPFLDVSFVDVSVDAQSLAPGNYFGNIQVSAPGASNSPQTVVVMLNVLPPGSNPGPQVRPTGLVFTGVAGADNPGSQNVMVANVTATPVSFGSSPTFVSGGNWFKYLPTSATLTPTSPGQIVIQPDFTGLAPSILRGVLTMGFDDGSVRTVSILSVVAPASPGTSASSSGENSGARMASDCSPTKLQILLTSSEQVFTAILNQPNSLEVQVVDDCGGPVTKSRGGAAVKATFSNGDTAINLVHTTNGRWSGTWQPRGVGGAVLVQLTAFLILGNGALYAGQTTLTANLGTRAIVPLQKEVDNGASLLPQLPVAPGTLIAVIGTELAETESTAVAPLPTLLGGTRLFLGGQPLPLIYASGGQLNAQVPYGLAVNTELQLQVQRGQTLSLPEQITVAPAQPAIFTQGASGAGQGEIFNLNNIIVDAAAPATAGDTVVIYCTGLGEVDPLVVAGAPAPSPPSQTSSPVSVLIGGITAQVTFSGLSPGLAAVYRINAVVPLGVTPSNQVPVTVAVAGQTSPPVTMAVR